MNSHQEQFYSFIMERVDSAHKDSAEALLRESFEKQDNGTFNLDFLQKFEDSMTDFLKPEHKDEVVRIMNGFRQQFNK